MNVCVELFTTAWRVGEFSDKPVFYVIKAITRISATPVTTCQPVKEYTLFPGDQG